MTSDVVNLIAYGMMGALGIVLAGGAIFAQSFRRGAIFGLMATYFFSAQLVVSGFDFLALAVAILSTLLFVALLQGGLFLSWTEEASNKWGGIIGAITLTALMGVLGYSFLKARDFDLPMSLRSEGTAGVSQLGLSLVSDRFLEVAIFGVAALISIIGIGSLVRRMRKEAS